MPADRRTEHAVKSPNTVIDGAAGIATVHVLVDGTHLKQAPEIDLARTASSESTSHVRLTSC